MSTRTVTDTVLQGDGSPAATETVTFYRRGGTFTTSASLPPSPVSTTTDEDGAYSIDLTPNTEGVVKNTWLAIYPNNESFEFTLFPGAPISMSELRIAGLVVTWSTPDLTVAMEAYRATWDASLAATQAEVTSVGALGVATSEEVIDARTAVPTNQSPVLADAIEWSAGSVYNISAFGAALDSTTNDAAAIQAAITAAPSRDTAWTIYGSRTAGTTTIVIPRPTTTNYVKVGTKITVPVTKSVRFVGPGMSGTRLKYTGTGSYMFEVTGGSGTGSPSYNVIEFENLILDSGGVELKSYSIGDKNFRRVHFDGTPGVALKVGIQVFPGVVDDCLISSCAGGIEFSGIYSDLWHVHHSRFWRNSDVDIKLSSTTARIEYNDFELRPAANYDKPHIQVVGSNCGLSWLVGNRFGPEVDGTDGPPRECIVLGDLTIDTGSILTVAQLWISQNLFQGRTSALSATSANSAIKINTQIQHVHIIDNEFNAYYTALVEENHYQNSGQWGTNSYGNIYRSNTVAFAHLGSHLSEGGVGFKHDLPVGDISRQTVNLLRTTDNLASASWTKTNCTVAMDVTGPDGVANSGATITRTGTGANIRCRQTGTMANGSAVFSVRLKAGTLSTARIAIQDAINNRWLTARYEPIALTGEWQTVVIVGPKIVITGSPALDAYILVGNDQDGGTTGTILAAFPQLEVGTSATKYQANSGTTAPAARAYAA